jgi:hypothetical protein
MSVNPVHLTLRVGLVWALLNLLAALFFSALFAVEQAAWAVVQRRIRRQHGAAPVVSISRR